MTVTVRCGLGQTDCGIVGLTCVVDEIDELEDMLLEELEIDMDEVIVDGMELVVVIVKLQIAPLTDPELKEVAPMACFM